MSFLKKLFGGGTASSTASAPAAEAEHQGYVIRAYPQKEGAQFRLYGTISKEEDGVAREHRLVRADLFSDPQECADATIRKAKLVIKEQGDAMFSVQGRGSGD